MKSPLASLPAAPLALAAPLIALVLVACPAPAPEPEAPPRPHVVVIFSDELAPEFLGAYGGSLPTPNLDRLAAGGMRFDRAYSAAPMCTPSRFGLLTGTYAGRSIDPAFLEAYPRTDPYSIAWNTYLTPETTTLPRVLSAAGYVTGMAGKWHLGRELAGDEELPALDPDADPADPEVEARLKERQRIVRRRIAEAGGFDEVRSASWGNLDGFPVRALAMHNFPWITRGAVDFITEHGKGERPFFLYVATTAVHGPYHPDEYQRDPRYTVEGRRDDVARYAPDADAVNAALAEVPEHLRHKYAGMVSLDHHVGVILDTLEEQGLADDTLVVFMADHNTEPAKATCFEKGSVVPMLVRWPGTVPAGSSTGALVQGVDLLPTLAELAGAKPPARVDGVSLVPVWRNPAATVRDHVYLESGYARAVTDGAFKYIAVRYPEAVIARLEAGEDDLAPNHLDAPRQAHSQIAIEHYPGYFDPDQLYDLGSDPYEQSNVAADPAHAETLQALRRTLEAQLRTFEHPYDLAEIPFLGSDEYREMAERTRAVGTDWIPWLPRDHGRIVWPPEPDPAP